jgi:hypothetical protein
MTIFTIDNENNITVFAPAEAAAAAGTTPFDLFTDQKELAELLASWPAQRWVATYNSLPGVKPVKALKDPKTAASKIGERVEKLGQMVAPQPVAAQPEAALAKPKARKKAKAGARVAQGAPVQGKASKQATPAKAAPTGNKAGKAQEASAPRECSKTAQMIAMLQRKGPGFPRSSFYERNVALHFRPGSLIGPRGGITPPGARSRAGTDARLWYPEHRPS